MALSSGWDYRRKNVRRLKEWLFDLLHFIYNLIQINLIKDKEAHY